MAVKTQFDEGELRSITQRLRSLVLDATREIVRLTAVLFVHSVLDALPSWLRFNFC